MDDNEKAIKKLSQDTFFSPSLSIGKYFPENTFNKNEILEVIDVMSKNHNTRKRLKNSRSNFIGNLVLKNIDNLTTEDLFDIHQKLSPIASNIANSCSPCLESHQTNSSKIIQNCINEDILNYINKHRSNHKINLIFSEDNIECTILKERESHQSLMVSLLAINAKLYKENSDNTVSFNLDRNSLQLIQENKGKEPNYSISSIHSINSIKDLFPSSPRVIPEQGYVL